MVKMFYGYGEADYLHFVKIHKHYEMGLEYHSD